MLLVLLLQLLLLRAAASALIFSWSVWSFICSICICVFIAAVVGSSRCGWSAFAFICSTSSSIAPSSGRPARNGAAANFSSSPQNSAVFGSAVIICASCGSSCASTPTNSVRAVFSGCSSALDGAVGLDVEHESLGAVVLQELQHLLDGRLLAAAS